MGKGNKDGGGLRKKEEGGRERTNEARPSYVLSQDSYHQQDKMKQSHHSV